MTFLWCNKRPVIETLCYRWTLRDHRTTEELIDSMYVSGGSCAARMRPTAEEIEPVLERLERLGRPDAQSLADREAARGKSHGDRALDREG